VEPFSIPAIVLAFLLRLGCVPVQEVYLVDKIEISSAPGGAALSVPVEVPGAYCPAVKEPYCPKAPAVFMRRDVKDLGVLVHELWHSCQPPAAPNTWQQVENERQAKKIELRWRDRD